MADKRAITEKHVMDKPNTFVTARRVFIIAAHWIWVVVKVLIYNDSIRDLWAMCSSERRFRAPLVALFLWRKA